MGLLEDINLEKNYLIYLCLGILVIMFLHINYLNNQVENMANVNNSVNSELKEYINQIYKGTDLLKRNRLKVSAPNIGGLRIGNEENYWEIIAQQDDTYKLLFTSYSTEGFSSELSTLRNNKGSFALQRYINGPVTRKIVNNVNETFSYSTIN